MIEQIFSYFRIDFTVDHGPEFARYASGSDWAVAIDEMQPSPHRRAARPQSLADRFRLVRLAVSKLRPRIDAHIKTSWIERRRFKQFLRKIVLGDAAVGRDAEICSQKCQKRNHNRSPFLKFRITQPKRCQPPTACERD